MAAIWGKGARGELASEHALVLDRAFVGDVRDGRLTVLAVSERVIARSLVCARDHGLRGADAVQLASALVAREADPAVDTMAVFDGHLRRAAAADGFALLPAG